MFSHVLLTVFFSRAFETGLAAIVGVFVIRVFGLNILGTANLAIATVGIFATILEVGFSAYLSKSVTQKDRVTDAISVYLWTKIAALVLFTLALLFAFLIKRPANFDFLLYSLVVIYTVFTSIYEIVATIFSAEQKYLTLTYQRTISVIVKSLITVLTLFFFRNLYGYLIILISEVITQVIVGWKNLTKYYTVKLHLPEKAYVRHYVSYTIPFIAATVTGRFFVYFDKLIIGYLINPVAVGVFVAAQAISNPFYGVVKTVTTTVHPKITKDALESAKELGRRLKEVVMFNSLVGSLLVIQLIIVSEIVTKVILDQDNYHIVLAAQMYALVILGKLISSPFLSLVQATEKHHATKWLDASVYPAIKTLMYFICIPSSILGLPGLDMGAAAIPFTTGVLWFLYTLPLVLWSLRDLHVSHHVLSGFKVYALAICSLLLSIYLAHLILPDNVWIKTAFNIIVTNTIFIALCFKSNVVSKQVLFFIKQAIGSFPSYLRAQVKY